MSENSDRYRRALAGFSAVVDAVPSDRWSSPSPCEGWTAAHVVGHVISGTQMISVAQTGEAPSFGDPLTLAGDDPAASFGKARDLAVSTLTEEFLPKNVETPMGEMTVDQMLAMFLTNDMLIHTWDLAQAAGTSVELDEQLVEEAYNAMVPIDAMLRRPNLFGPKVEPPAGADPTTKLMCFVGRRAAS